MKFIFPFALLSMSPAAIACPDLSGSYLCEHTSFRPDTVYTYARTREGEDWRYSVVARIDGQQRDSSAYEFLTDGKEREVRDSVNGLRLLMSASCMGNTLEVLGTANFDQPQPIHFSEELSLTDEGDLFDVSDTASGNTMQEICKRMPAAKF